MGTTWTVTEDETPGDGWTEVAELADDEKFLWTTVIPSGVAKKDTYLGVSEGAENFSVKPEDVQLPPEQVQADSAEWTILNEAT